MLLLLFLGLSISHVGLALFFGGLALLAYVYFGYPVLLTLLGTARGRREPPPADDLGITLIIAAHNERLGIRQKLEETLALDYPKDKLEIIVASDGSTDGTEDIVLEFAGRGVQLVTTATRGGKTHAQNVAVPYAGNEILVFSDATTRYQPDALRYIAGHYRSLAVGAVSGCYQYYDPTSASPTASGSRRFWSFENHIKTMQSRLRTISGCCGCIYSVRRRLYTPLSPRVISDLVQPLHVLMQGFTVAFEPRARAWEETTTTTRQEFQMRVRVITRGMRGLLSVAPLLAPWQHPWIAAQLWSHKVLRWFTPLFCLAVFAGNVLLLGSPIFAAFFALQLAFYAAALLAAGLPPERRPRLLTLPLYICTINAASLVSLVQLLLGQSYTTWQPVRR